MRGFELQCVPDEGTGMGVRMMGGALFGIILGQFFKCYVIIVICGLAVVMEMFNPARIEHSFLGWFLQIYAEIISIQVGYVIGLFGRRFTGGRHNCALAAIAMSDLVPFLITWLRQLDFGSRTNTEHYDLQGH